MDLRVHAYVDAYIEALSEWQQFICQQIDDLVHSADPEHLKTSKYARQPYFVLSGNVCALLAAKGAIGEMTTWLGTTLKN